jgi:hypothetical protein
MASEWVDETCSTPSQQTRILVVDDRALVYRKKFSRHARARGSLQVRRHPSVRPDLRRRGCMRLSPGVPATAKTLYNMASLTKPVTAEAVFRHSCPCFSARLPTCGGKTHSRPWDLFRVVLHAQSQLLPLCRLLDNIKVRDRVSHPLRCDSG